MSTHRSHPQQWPDKAIFTLGHSTLPIDAFLALLAAYGIERVVDVRIVPRSRHNPQFNEPELAAALKSAGVDYARLPALGGLRHPRKDSPNAGWRNEGFRGFADHMQTEAFCSGLDALVAMSERQRVAIMCAEVLPWRCHRSLIADALVVRAVPVVEILSPTDHRRHALTPFAHVEGATITYPPEQPSLL